MLGLFSLFFLGWLLTLRVFFFSDSGTLGKGFKSSGMTGTASLL